MEEIKAYSIEEVSQILKVTRRTLYTYLKDGRLRATKIGKEWRVRHQDLEAFLTGDNQR